MHTIILLTAATPFEIAPTLQWLEEHYTPHDPGVFEKNGLVIHVLVTGVGSVATAFELGKYFALNQPKWAVNAGIAGAFDPNLPLGTVVQVVSERFGDLGVEEQDGTFTDVYALGFSPKERYEIAPPYLPGLPACHGLTVHKVHGTANSIEKITRQYPDVQVETMEGAAFVYACQSFEIPCAQIRSISNRVEPRNREAWDLPLAIQALNRVLIEMIESLEFEDRTTPQ